MSTNEPPRLTIGQALAIIGLLIIGFAVIRNGFSLIFLVAAMGLAAFLLNALFKLILRWALRGEAPPDDINPG